MKKILIIYWLIISAWIYLAFTAMAANAQKPSFFVPDNAFKTPVEKPAIMPRLNRGAGMAASRNTNSPQPIFNKRKMSIKQAPVDEIAKANHLTDAYIKSIKNSFALSKAQLNTLLQDEFARINNNTAQLHQIINQWPQQSKAYQLANYMIKDQSSQEITQSRRQMKETKDNYQKLLAETEENDKVYIIEAQNPDLYLQQHGSIKGHWKKVTYISVFNNEKKHIFTYNRLHQDMLEDKQIPKIRQHEYEFFYQSFDNYLTDLRRIGQGLDVQNPTLLKQMSEMEDIVILK